MHAAVVTDFTKPPRSGDFREPEAAEGRSLVTMEAAAVHRIVRSIASGAHYSSGDELPIVPGVDGIGRLADGTRVYTGGTEDPFGTLAERASVATRFTFPVPEGLDTALAAAIVNPAMSSWAPMAGLLQPGATVLALGATGVSGGLAVRIAKLLGAGRVVAAGRNGAALAELAGAADAVVQLGAVDEAAQLAASADGFDLVLDYVWGPIAERLLMALARSARGTGRPIRWVQIGSTAGPDIALPSAVLRQAPITLSGSGLGSIEPALLGRVIPAVLAAAADGAIAVDFETHRLADVETAWSRPGRLVFLP